MGEGKTDSDPVYHSILGDRIKARGTFREFVIFDDDQIYVEYVVFYRRVFVSEKGGVWTS